MHIHESNNMTLPDIEIKVEKSEEASSVDKLSAQIISRKSAAEDKFSLKECSFVEHETVIFKTEQDDSFPDLTESKLNVKGNIDEDSVEFKYIVPEEVYIKNEVREEDRFNINEPNEGEIKDEYFDESESIVHEDIVIKTEDQEEEESSNKYEKSTTKNGQRKHCCDKCTYETNHKSHFIRHIRVHDKANVPKYSCHQCQYQTIYSSHLRTHLKTHNCFGLICILCQKSYKQKVELDAHYVSRHPDRSDKWGSTITNKIKECPKCLYKTVIISSFKNHLATHGKPPDQAPFHCNICEYKCTQKSYFTRHLRRHVVQLSFVCTDCDKRFNTKQELDGHIIYRHSENSELISSVTNKVRQCDKCDFKTVFSTHLKRHLQKCL